MLRLIVSRFENSSERGKIARVLLVLAQKLVKQIIDRTRAAAVRRPDPGDKGVKPTLEGLKLLDANDLEFSISRIEKVYVDLISANPIPETVKIARAVERVVLTIIKDLVKF